MSNPYAEYDKLMTLSNERKARRQVNTALEELIYNKYFQSLPLLDIDEILVRYGFSTLQEGIYCGCGSINEQVGVRTWFAMTWYRMETGRYEIVAYVS